MHGAVRNVRGPNHTRWEVQVQVQAQPRRQRGHDTTHWHRLVCNHGLAERCTPVAVVRAPAQHSTAQRGAARRGAAQPTVCHPSKASAGQRAVRTIRKTRLAVHCCPMLLRALPICSRAGAHASASLPLPRNFAARQRPVDTAAWRLHSRKKCLQFVALNRRDRFFWGWGWKTLSSLRVRQSRSLPMPGARTRITLNGWLSVRFQGCSGEAAERVFMLLGVVVLVVSSEASAARGPAPSAPAAGFSLITWTNFPDFQTRMSSVARGMLGTAPAAEVAAGTALATVRVVNRHTAPNAIHSMRSMSKYYAREWERVGERGRMVGE